MFKKVIILVELVRDRGGQITDYFDAIEIESQIEWKLEFLNIPKPTTKAKKSWEKFKYWLKIQPIITICDFKQFSQLKVQVLACKKYYSRKTNTITEYYQYYTKSNDYHQVDQFNE